MLYFIASMPVTVGSQIAECLCTVTVLPYVRSCDLSYVLATVPYIVM